MLGNSKTSLISNNECSRTNETEQRRLGRRASRTEVTSISAKKEQNSRLSTAPTQRPVNRDGRSLRRSQRLTGDTALTVTVTRAKAFSAVNLSVPDLRGRGRVRTGRLGDERALKHQERSRFSTGDKHKANVSGTQRGDLVPSVNTVQHGSTKLVTRSTTTRGPISKHSSISSNGGQHLDKKQGTKRRMTIGERNCWIARQEYMKHRRGSSPVTINTEKAEGLKASTGKTKTNHLSNQMRQKRSKTERTGNGLRKKEKPDEQHNDMSNGSKARHDGASSESEICRELPRSQVPSRATHPNRHNTKARQSCTP